MNIDTRLMYDRYIVASYGGGPYTVKDTVTQTTVSGVQNMPTTRGGFEQLFERVKTLQVWRARAGFIVGIGKPASVDGGGYYASIVNSDGTGFKTGVTYIVNEAGSAVPHLDGVDSPADLITLL